MKDEPIRLAAEGVWEKVLDLIGECKGHKILDAPAGQGGLSEKLRRMEAQVVSLDLNASNLNGHWVQCDMNLSLPFKDGQFDKAICVEGVEHLENPSYLLREFSRVLKDGGTLILTTPNTLNIRSRIKFAMTGCLYWFGDYALTKTGHITPIALYHLIYFSKCADFKIIKTTINKTVLWMWVMIPVFKFFGMLPKEKYNQSKILSGEILILKMEKVGCPKKELT